MGMTICAVCDAEMNVSDEKGMPLMLLTGDIEYGSERIAHCPVCGNRRVLKD